MAKQGGKEPFQLKIDEKALGKIRNPNALKMAKEVALALNQIMRGDYDYRKYKKEPREKLTKAANYLLKLAVEEPATPIPIDLSEVEGSAIKNIYKEDINQMVLARKSNNEIHEMLFTRHKTEIKHPTLSAYISRYKKTSEYIKAANDWAEQLGELRLYYKKGRLLELEQLYIDAFRGYQLKPTKSNVELCLKILEQARREAMPTLNQVTVNNNSITQNIFTNILAKEEEAAIFERLPLHEIIIGRVSAKYKRDPYLLQRRLQNSYYASQAGARGMDRLDEEIEYPTAILYNVEELGNKWRAIQAEEAKVVKDADVLETLNEDPSDIKAALLKRVMERKKKGESGGEEKEDK